MKQFCQMRGIGGGWDFRMSVLVGSLKTVASKREGWAMNEADAYSSWRGGELVPGRITLARAYLDLPQQSVAYVCGTDAETVDLWEQGAEYPSLGELFDLMALTGLGIRFFVKPVVGPGPLFAVPRCWAGDRSEMDALCGEFCTPAVKAAVRGWPRESESLPASMFV